mgnify:CR=1 FL=1
MKEVVYNNPIVSVIEKKNESDYEKKIITLESPNWVNIIPITKNNEVVFVRQFRHGISSETLEIPGGMIDNHESPMVAAERELFEETGYACEEIIELGNISPNPALFNNRVFTFMGKGAYLKDANIKNQDEINEVALIDSCNVPKLFKTGLIDHALVLAAFHLMGLKK